MIELELSIDSKGNRLSGTLCLPSQDGVHPVVLMVHGSGPLDRNENTRGQHLNVFNKIAEHLASIGVASLRYDKRGCGKSGGVFLSAGHADLVEDAVHWMDALVAHEHCQSEKIFILGHSEGCIIAPQVGIQRADVAGLILLCPFVDRLESILRKQAGQIQRDIERLPGFQGMALRLLTRIFGSPTAFQEGLIARLKASQSDTIRMRLRKIPAKWFRELMRIDPPGVYRQVVCPMLLIGGEKDLQCEPADVGRIARLAVGPVESHVVTDLTHILRFEEGPATLFGTAKLLKRPVEPFVLELISSWLQKSSAITAALP